VTPDCRRNMGATSSPVTTGKEAHEPDERKHGEHTPRGGGAGLRVVEAPPIKSRRLGVPKRQGRDERSDQACDDEHGDGLLLASDKPAGGEADDGYCPDYQCREHVVTLAVAYR
jgi:hypothetical protein